MSAQMITEKRLKEVLRYDPLTGVFVWKKQISAHAMVGTIVKCAITKGRPCRIGIDGKRYKAHRLAWLYIYGVMPEKGIDHRDMDCTNNRISNLRLAGQSENGANRGPERGNEIGFKGVSWHRRGKKWVSQIRKMGVQYYLGLFINPKDAALAYDIAAKKLFGKFARLNFPNGISDVTL